MGSSSFSSAVRDEIRLYDWKIIPTVAEPYAASSFGPICAKSLAPASIRPEVGRSSPPIRFKRVDFPEPDLPKSATRSPRRTSNDAPRSAST
jgi:hypothetical protein